MLIVDMRRVNWFMKPIHFKREDTPTLEQLMMKDNYVMWYKPKEVYDYVVVHIIMQDLLVGSII
jgi:hypothetical protein